MPYLDILLLGAVLLLLSTAIGTIMYYKRIKKAREEYEKARTAVSDIVVSFNRQLQRQEENLSALSHKTEVLSVNSTNITDKLEEHGIRLGKLSTKVAKFPPTDRELSAEIQELKKHVETLAKTHEETMQRVAEIPETRIEAAIPIKKERALAPLTETELLVLEILADEGKKTAPEIKDSIRLTREHTARLMKKLYVSGYVERDETKMPYAYRVKEEMRRILKKTDSVSQ